MALGVAGSLATTRVLATLLFDVKPTDTATFAAVCLLLGSVAVLPGWLPAMRATRVDPLTVLRYQ